MVQVMMVIRFKPALWLTLFSLPAFFVLLYLGNWQMSRAEWKRELRAHYVEIVEKPALSVAQLDDLVLSENEYRRVAFPEGLALQSANLVEGRLYGYNDQAGPGWKGLTVLKIGGSSFAAEARFHTLDTENTAELKGWRVMPVMASSRFALKNNFEAGRYYRLDELLEKLSGETHGLHQGYWLSAYSGSGKELPPGIEDMPPSRHIGYALTWYGIALGLLGVYFGFHVAEKRLTLPGSGKKEI